RRGRLRPEAVSPAGSVRVPAAEAAAAVAAALTAAPSCAKSAPPVRTDDLDFHLPPGLVASRPPDERDGARMLVVDGAQLLDAHVRDLAEHVPPGALVVVNDTRVLRARLLGKKEGTGGRVEIFVLEPVGEAGGARARWRALG